MAALNPTKAHVLGMARPNVAAPRLCYEFSVLGRGLSRSCVGFWHRNAGGTISAEGELDMTKAKARERAKAKAAQKAKKRAANAGQLSQTIRPGQFDPGPGSIKGVRVNAKSFTRAKTGSARSR